MTDSKRDDEHATLFRFLGKFSKLSGSGGPDFSDETREERLERLKAGYHHVRMEYPDEFAPSQAEFETSDPSLLRNPPGRLLGYNQQLIPQLEDVMNEAAALGCPPLQMLFPVGWTHVDEKTYVGSLETVGALSWKYAEDSPEWLVLKCYLHALNASHYATDGADALVISNEMMMVSAALREVELVRRNKEHAARGRKNVAAASKGGQTRNHEEQSKHAVTLAQMKQRIDAGKTVSDAARLTFKAGHGTSEAANRKLWHRHRSK